MSSLTQILLWCPVQVSVLACAALGVGSLLGRRRPAAGASVTVAALLAVAGLTATAFCPWPAWHLGWEKLPWSHAADSHGQQAQPAERETPIRFAQSRPADDLVDARTIAGDSPREAAVPTASSSRLWTALADHWLGLVAAIYFVGVAGMAVRIALGFAAVRSYRRNSHPVTDRRLGELADVVCAQLGCVKGIELRETTRLSTPATIGWLRPMLLLPSDWRTWTDDERQAVLAHEIEHVRRNDFAAWIAAQLGVALHFYHPLVHGLANRLRLQQELAADAAAARVVGGQRKYVTMLAAMALRQADQPLAWPANAFLPNSKTFVRRIEMLHRSKSLGGDVSRPVVFLSVAAVLVAAVCAAGIRGSVAGDDRADSKDADSLVVALNQDAPPAKFQLKQQQQVAQDLNHAIEDRGKIVQDFNHLKQLALAMHNYHSKNQHFPPAVVLGPDGKTPHSWRVELLPYLDQNDLYSQYRMNEPWDSENNKKVLEQMPACLRNPYDDPKSTNSGYYVLVGPGTIFEGKDGIKIQDITDGTSNTLMVVESKRNIPWTKPEDISFDPEKPLPELGGFEKGHFATALADGSAQRFETEKAKDQLKWLIIRNDGHVIDFEKLGAGRIPVSINPVRRRRPTDAPTRTQNNLKQLALAMHNYHDKHGHFPPAVVMGPDGKTPHSWRVELLPYLDQAALFKEYRVDEPWDSESNKKVLAQAPDVFRSPYDDPKSTNSGYFAFDGPGSVFEGPDGIKISEIIDGTSNTIMIVEAKRNIPWTKPEDIPFDPTKPLPELGGFVKGRFNAALADGSARSFQTDGDKDDLKWRIMRNDGHVINAQ
jgi:beta-lactamase regulating signal transducer with metallopeptidase domain